MKIIHCADIHLDSALSTNMTVAQAAERRGELVKTWANMVQYAADNEVRVIIIAGDWFDTANISVKTAEIVSGVIKKYSDIDFVYLAGNHDEKACVDMLGRFANLKVFGKETKSFSYDNVVVSAMDDIIDYNQLKLNKDNVNIVVAHGDMPDIKSFVGLGVDYLALGHIHKYKVGNIDSRGIWCYSGCLEARGYDEGTVQGFVLLDISKEGVSHTFVPFGYRHVRNIDIEVSYDLEENGMDTIEICDKIVKELEGIPGRDMVKVRLKGYLKPGQVINTRYIHSYFKDKFYGFRVEDNTAMVLDITALSKERSLKGEFIRAVLASKESEELKRSIIRCGLSALIGEVIEG